MSNTHPSSVADKIKQVTAAADKKVELTAESIQVLNVLYEVIREFEHKLDTFISRTSEEDNRSKECCKQLLSPERIKSETIMSQRVSLLWTGAIWVLTTVGAGIIGGILYYTGIAAK